MHDCLALCFQCIFSTHRITFRHFFVCTLCCAQLWTFFHHISLSLSLSASPLFRSYVARINILFIRTVCILINPTQHLSFEENDNQSGKEQNEEKEKKRPEFMLRNLFHSIHQQYLQTTLHSTRFNPYFLFISFIFNTVPNYLLITLLCIAFKCANKCHVYRARKGNVSFMSSTLSQKTKSWICEMLTQLENRRKKRNVQVYLGPYFTIQTNHKTHWIQHFCRNAINKYTYRSYFSLFSFLVQMSTWMQRNPLPQYQ